MAAQTVSALTDTEQTVRPISDYSKRSSLIRICTVCHSLNIFWTHFSAQRTSFWIFGVILGVQNFGLSMCLQENTIGRTCSQCVEKSFSLDAENPSGCTDCFCFDRANTCGQAPYVWTKVNNYNILMHMSYFKF